MADTFKIGDIVTLKSGGPKMTVTRIGKDHLDRWEAGTTWFAGSKNEHGTFPVETLVLAPAAEPKPK